MKRLAFEGWKGNFYDSYFDRLENGEWVRISLFKYLWLKLTDHRVRTRFE